MRALDALPEDFTIVAYDRRESGSSGGRVEKLSWALFADQAKGLLTISRSATPTCSAAGTSI